MSIIPTSPDHSNSRVQPAWLRLPIAPQAQARVRFVAPDALGRALLPVEALDRIGQTLEQGMELEMVELVGPGDPLATPEITLECVRAIRDRYQDLPITISTLGLGIETHAAEFARLKVGINLLVDAVRPEVVEKIFAWIRPERKTIPLARVAPLLVEGQVRAMTACDKAGPMLTISTMVYPGYNDEHIEEIARTVADLGGKTMILQPFMPCGAEDEPPGPGRKQLVELGGLITKYLPLTAAPDYIGVPQDDKETGCSSASGNRPRPRKGRPNVAVLSGNGMDIDLHLGKAIKALIYGPRQDGLACLLEARALPEAGGGDKRWQQLAETLDDCFVLLAASAGQKPREILGQQGLPLLITEDNVEGYVDVLYGGGKKGKCRK